MPTTKQTINPVTRQTKNAAHKTDKDSAHKRDENAAHKTDHEPHISHHYLHGFHETFIPSTGGVVYNCSHACKVTQAMDKVLATDVIDAVLRSVANPKPGGP